MDEEDMPDLAEFEGADEEEAEPRDNNVRRLKLMSEGRRPKQASLAIFVLQVDDDVVTHQPKARSSPTSGNNASSGVVFAMPPPDPETGAATGGAVPMPVNENGVLSSSPTETTALRTETDRVKYTQGTTSAVIICVTETVR